MNLSKLLDKNFWRKALRLAIPVALQNMLTSSFVLVDTLMVGQLGDVALAAVGMAGQLSWLLNIVIFGICSGAAVFVSQYWGNKDIDGIHKTIGISVMSSMVVSLLFLLAGTEFPEFVVSIFNRDPEIISAGSEYLIIAAFSYPAIVLGAVLSAVLRSTEEVKLPMYSALFTTILNMFLDYVLIFGAFGLPGLGIAGAAIATCISSWAGPVLIILVSIYSRNILIAPFKKLFGFSWGMVKDFYIKATPVILNESLWGLGTMIYNVIFANSGYENYAALTIFRTFENFTFVFFVGLCNACCVMVGKQIGSGNIKLAADDSKRFAVIIPMCGLFIGLTVIILRKYLVSIFNMGDNISQYTMQVAESLMVIYGCHIGIRNIPYIQIVGIFRSGGDTAIGTKYDTACLWGMALPAVLISAYLLKLPFLWLIVIMYVCEDYIKAFLCIRHFKSLKWIKPVTEEGRAGLKEYLEQI